MLYDAKYNLSNIPLWYAPMYTSHGYSIMPKATKYAYFHADFCHKYALQIFHIKHESSNRYTSKHNNACLLLRYAIPNIAIEVVVLNCTYNTIGFSYC